MAVMAEQLAREKRLQGSKCERCGSVSFPALSVCPNCGPAYAKEVFSTELPTMGTVVTWTRLQVAPKGFPSPLLHCVLDVGAVKILGTVQGASSIENGDRLLIAEDQNGKFPFIFCRPAKIS